MSINIKQLGLIRRNMRLQSSKNTTQQKRGRILGTPKAHFFASGNPYHMNPQSSFLRFGEPRVLRPRRVYLLLLFYGLFCRVLFYSAFTLTVPCLHVYPVYSFHFLISCSNSFLSHSNQEIYPASLLSPSYSFQ